MKIENMYEQDKRAVEGMARCGISLEGLIEAFAKFPADEIKKIYEEIHKDDTPVEEAKISINCS